MREPSRKEAPPICPKTLNTSILEVTQKEWTLIDGESYSSFALSGGNCEIVNSSGGVGIYRQPDGDYLLRIQGQSGCGAADMILNPEELGRLSEILIRGI